MPNVIPGIVAEQGDAATPALPIWDTLPTLSLTGPAIAGEYLIDILEKTNGTVSNGTLNGDNIYYVNSEEIDLPSYVMPVGSFDVVVSEGATGPGGTVYQDSAPLTVEAEAPEPTDAESWLTATLADETNTLWAMDFRTGEGRSLTTHGNYTPSTIVGGMPGFQFANHGAPAKVLDYLGNLELIGASEPLMMTGKGLLIWDKVTNLIPDSDAPVGGNYALTKTGTSNGRHVLYVVGDGSSVTLDNVDTTGLSISVPALASPGSPLQFTITGAGSVSLTNSSSPSPSEVYLQYMSQSTGGKNPVLGQYTRLIVSNGSAATRNAERPIVNLGAIPGYDQNGGLTIVGRCSTSFIGSNNKYLASWNATGTGSTVNVSVRWEPSGSGWRLRFYRGSTIEAQIPEDISVGSLETPEITWAITIGASGVKMAAAIRVNDITLHSFGPDDAGMSSATPWSTTSLVYMAIGTDYQNDGNTFFGSYGFIPFTYVRKGESDAARLEAMVGRAVANQSVQAMMLGNQHPFLAYDTTTDPWNDRGYRWNVKIKRTGIEDLIEVQAHERGGLQRTEETSGRYWVDPDGTVHPETDIPTDYIEYTTPHTWNAAGVMTAQFPTGLSGVTVSGGSGASYNSTTGEVTSNVVAGKNVSNNIVRVRIPWSSIPSGGIPRPTLGLTRGETTATDQATRLANMDPLDEVTPETAANFAAICSVYRAMTPQGVNGMFKNMAMGGRTATALPQRTARWTGWTNWDGTLCEELLLQMANGAGVDLWDNGISVYDTDALITEKMTVYATSSYCAANRLRIEPWNEMWNDPFQNTWDGTLSGVRRGYTPLGVTTHAGATPETILDGMFLGFDRYSRVLPVALTTGDRIMVDINGGGYLVYEALVDIDAGHQFPAVASQVPQSEPGVLNLVYGNVDTRRAMWRFKGRRIKEYKALIDPIFAGESAQTPIYILGGAQNADWNTSIFYALEFDDAYQSIDAVAYGAYGTNLGAYRENRSVWPVAQRDLIYHDMAAATAYYNAAVRSSLVNQADNLRDRKLKTAVFLFDRGADTESIRTYTYEGLEDHLVLQDWPDQCGSYSAGVTYVAGAFCYVAGEGTYISLISSNQGNTPSSSPSAWEIYEDGTGQLWDDEFSISVRAPGGGTAARPVRQFLDAVRRSEGAADNIEEMGRQIALKVGDVHVKFAYANNMANWSSVASIGNAYTYQILGWGNVDTDLDTGPECEVFHRLAAMNAEYKAAA